MHGGDVAKKVVAAIWGLSVLFAAVVAAFVIGTATVLPFAILPRGRRERYAIVGASWWARTVVWGICLSRPRVTGELRLREGEGCMILCNHRSWLDPLLLMATTRSNGLSKAEIFWIPMVGVFGYLSGAVFFRRERPESRRAARDEVIALIRSGFRIQVFPEGTRSRSGSLRDKVHLTLAEDAWHAGIPVVPCAVMHTERTLPPGVFGAFPFEDCRLHIGEAIRPSDHPDAAAFAAACWHEVSRRVDALQSEDEVDSPALAASAR